MPREKGTADVAKQLRCLNQTHPLDNSSSGFGRQQACRLRPEMLLLKDPHPVKGKALIEEITQKIFFQNS